MKKEDLIRQIEQLVEPILAEQKLELFDIEFRQEPAGSFLRVFIDSEQGVDIEACVRLNEVLGKKLDQSKIISGHYTLEVSSPGIERPLKKEKDYQKALGSKIYIKTFAPIGNQKEFTGVLESVERNSVTIRTQKDSIRVPLNLITKAHLVADF